MVNFFLSFIVIITCTMAVYMGYMLHNTRKMVFRYFKNKKRKKKQKVHKKTTPAKGETKGRPRGDQGEGSGFRGEEENRIAWLLCKATCEDIT